MSDMAAQRPSTSRAPRVKADPACVEAVELARAAAVAQSGDWGPHRQSDVTEPVTEVPTETEASTEASSETEEPTEASTETEATTGTVGEHLGHTVDGDRIVTHRFASTDPAYRGWHWSVTVVRAARAKDVTVNEVVLLPGPDALLGQPWVPWEDRIGPGDLVPGALMPTADDDPRLEPGYTGGEDAADVDPAEASATRVVVAELGLGRERVLSIEGRDEAVERWLTSDGGPDTPMAHQAPGHCVSCGYFVRLRGSFGTLFGVCANKYSPSDGRVVHLEHGCGGHSDVVDDRRPREVPGPVWDTINWDTDSTIFD